MVTIPTSRDIGRVSARSGRIAPSGPSVGVGSAIANLGQGITQAAFDLDELREREAAENANKRSLDVSTAMTRFFDEEERRFLEEREGASESGIGFTRQFMESYQDRANEFARTNFEGLEPEQQAGYLNRVLGQGNALYGKAYAYEQTAKTSYYDRTINTNLDSARSRIQANAAPYDELKAQGLAAIDAADMPEAWKAERRQMWEADAAESKWRWEYEKDPERALRIIEPLGDVPSDIGGIIDQAAATHGVDGETLKRIAMIESRGNPSAKNPSSSAGGLFQQIDANAKEYGVADRFDPAQSADGAARFMRDNRNRLLKGIGREPTPGELYLAHQQGPGGAINLLRDPSARAVDVLGREQVRLNLPSSMRGRVDSITAGEFASLWTKKLGDVDASQEFASIPLDRREQLAAEGQTQYQQMITQERAAAKDNYSLVIATQPQTLTQQTILDDPLLDNGVKAQLITSLNSALKENAGVNEFIAGFSQGNVSVNAFDPEQRKVADKAYDTVMSRAPDDETRNAITSDFVATTGYVPRTVQNELRRGAASVDAPELSQAMQAADVLQKNAPVSFGNFDGSAEVQKKLDLYRSLTNMMGYSPEEAAKKILAANDPEAIRRRDALIKSDPVKKAIASIDAGDIAATFDQSLGGIAFNPRVGENPAAEAAIVGEYRSIFEESIVDADGDMTVAETLANERFGRMYGVSDLSAAGNDVVIKYPPEKAYPANIDGTHDYIREQLIEALAAEGVETTNVYLQADDATAADIKAGVPPRYQIFYEQDGKYERYYLPFFADPDEAKRRTLSQSEQRMLQNREAELQRQTREEGAEGAGDAAMDETIGPDWMRARAREMAIERARQEPTQLERIETRDRQDRIETQERQRSEAIEQERRDAGSLLRGGWVNN